MVEESKLKGKTKVCSGLAIGVNLDMTEMKRRTIKTGEAMRSVREEMRGRKK